MFLPNPGIMAAGAGVAPPGQQLFLGNGAFVVPEGVFSICIVSIGPGGASGYDGPAVGSGSGGGLAFSNNLPTTPGETLTVSNFIVYRGEVPLVGASAGNRLTPGTGLYGEFKRTGGAGKSVRYNYRASGAGAAGYTGDGWPGEETGSNLENGGGGTSPLGGGAGAAAGASNTSQGAAYGGGGAYLADNQSQPGGPGCVRFMWGAGRAFPNTNTGDL